MGSRISVTVLCEESDQPIEDALVQLDGVVDSSHSTLPIARVRTDRFGRASFVGPKPRRGLRRVVLFARASGRGSNARPFDSQLDLSRREHDVVIRLPAGRTYSGVVRDRTGNPIAGARIEVAKSTPYTTGWARRGDEAWGDPSPEARCYRIRDTAESDAMGRFELLDVVEIEGASMIRESIWLSVIHPAYAAWTCRGIERFEPQGSQDVRIEVVLVEGRTVRGSVVDHDGVPVEGASITVSPRMGDRCATADFLTESGRTRSDGGFDVEHLDDLELEVEIRAPGFLIRRLLVEAGSSSVHLVIEPLERGAVVEGIAFRPGGIPAVEEFVGLYRRDGSRLARTLTDEAGRFRFAGVPASETDGVVCLAAHSFPIAIPSRELVLRLNGKRDDLAFEILLVDASTGEPIPCSPDPGHARYAWGNRVQFDSSRVLQFEENGTALAFASPRGLAEVRVHAPGYRGGAMTIDVSALGADAVVTMRLEPAWIFEGELVDENGRAVVGALVTFEHRYSMSSPIHAVSDELGRFRLVGVHDEGSLVIEHRDFVIAVERLEPGMRGADGVIRYRRRLSRGGTIRGSVRRADGTPAVHEVVAIHGADGKYYLGLPWAVAGLDGRYVLETIPAMSLRLRCGREERMISLRDGEALVEDFVVRSSG